jgi:hypothetical protein
VEGELEEARFIGVSFSTCTYELEWRESWRKPVLSVSPFRLVPMGSSLPNPGLVNVLGFFDNSTSNTSKYVLLLFYGL